MLQFIIIALLSLGVLLLGSQKLAVCIPLLADTKSLNLVDQKIPLYFYDHRNYSGDTPCSPDERDWKSRYPKEDQETIREYEKVIEVIRDFLKRFTDRILGFEEQINAKNSAYLEKEKSINAVKELSVLGETEIKMLEERAKTILNDKKALEDSKLLAGNCKDKIEKSLEHFEELIYKLKDGDLNL